MNKHNHVGKNAYVSKVYTNIASEIVQITTDKLEIILKDYLDSIGRKSSWHTPLALVVSLILSFSTTEFKAALGISAPTWCAVFFMATVLSAIWLVIAWWGCSRAMTVEELLAKIKENK